MARPLSRGHAIDITLDIGVDVGVASELKQAGIVVHYNGLACTHGGASSVALRSDGGFLLFPTSPRNRLGEEFISALAQDFAKHGAAVIERVRQEKPAGYLKVVASLLPKDVNLNVRPLDDLSDEQLLMRLRVLTKQAAPLLARVAEDVGALQH